MTRFIVSVWHGQNGSIAEVRDRENPDDCLGIYSTVRCGPQWRTLADAQCAALNDAAKARQA